MDCYIHEKALVETDTIGDGTRIWAFAHVMADVVIGKECNIGDHAFIESGVRIGDRGSSVSTGTLGVLARAPGPTSDSFKECFA